MKNAFGLKGSVLFLFLFSFFYSFGQFGLDSSFSEEEDSIFFEEEDSSFSEPEEFGLSKDSCLTNHEDYIKSQQSYYSYGPGNKMKKVEKEEKAEKNKGKKSSIFSDIGNFIEEINAEIFVIILIIFIVSIILICLFVFYKNYSYKKEQKKSLLVEKSTEQFETIDVLSQAVQSKNYNEAIKIVYVQTLVWLNNRQIIHWEVSKTPSEYYYEVKDQSLREPFKELTHIFLLARYDDMIVDCDMFESAQKYKQQILSLTK